MTGLKIALLRSSMKERQRRQRGIVHVTPFPGRGQTVDTKKGTRTRLALGFLLHKPWQKRRR